MNVPLPPESVPPEQGPPACLSASAVLSFILGLLALPLNILAGLPALLIGYRGLYAINASEGRLRGRILAVAGMALGTVGCVIGIGFGLFLLFGHLGANAARLDCANNLREIGVALEAYQQNHAETYPAATIPNKQLAPDKRLSWMADILPFMRRRTQSTAAWQSFLGSIDQHKGWQDPANAAAANTRVYTFLCPGDANPLMRTTPGLTDYVGISGIGPDAAALAVEAPDAGFFGYDRAVRLPQATKLRASIMIVTETTNNNGPWIAGGPPTVRGVVPEEAPLIGLDRPFGGCHYSFTRVPGLNTLWLDASVRYLTNSAPPEMFADHARLHPAR
jgi:Protein of unknown function (DUF1559)